MTIVSTALATRPSVRVVLIILIPYQTRLGNARVWWRQMRPVWKLLSFCLHTSMINGHVFGGPNPRPFLLLIQSRQRLAPARCVRSYIHSQFIGHFSHPQHCHVTSSYANLYESSCCPCSPICSSRYVNIALGSVHLLRQKTFVSSSGNNIFQFVLRA